MNSISFSKRSSKKRIYIFNRKKFGDWFEDKTVKHTQLLFIIWILQEKKLPSILGYNIHQYLNYNKPPLWTCDVYLSSLF
jgi:hypothetical protein